MKITENNITLRFAKSTSQNYLKAIKIAKKIDTFTFNEQLNTNTLEISQDNFLEHFKNFEKIYEIVHNWKGTELLINEKAATVDEIRRLKQTLSCAAGMNFLGEKYCFMDQDIKEGWGCKHLQSIDRYYAQTETWRYYNYNAKIAWYDFGRFENKKWIIDKEKIKIILLEEAESKYLQLCPHFSLQKIDSILNLLPEQIDPEQDEIFELKKQEINDGYSIEEKITGIKPRSEELESDNETPQLGMRFSIKKEEREKKNRYIPDISFNDIGGLDEIIGVIREIIELPLKQPKLFEHMKIVPHKGILLYGPPGCGKTMIAKAIANEIDAHFIGIKGPELLNKYYGQSEENLRNVFIEAKELEPAILFFDEIDSIAQQRSSEENLRFDSRFVNQLLTLLDGIEDYGNIRVLASTNRPELLDSALLRPGRFDYHIEVKKPTEKGCFDIFSRSIKEMPLSTKFNIKNFSKELLGLTGADIAFIAREGAYNCIRRNINFTEALTTSKDIDTSMLVITQDDFEKALVKIKNK